VSLGVDSSAAVFSLKEIVAVSWDSAFYELKLERKLETMIRDLPVTPSIEWEASTFLRS
jgi:hypothetical protein